MPNQAYCSSAVVTPFTHEVVNCACTVVSAMPPVAYSWNQSHCFIWPVFQLAPFSPTYAYMCVCTYMRCLEEQTLKAVRFCLSYCSNDPVTREADWFLLSRCQPWVTSRPCYGAELDRIFNAKQQNSPAGVRYQHRFSRKFRTSWCSLQYPINCFKYSCLCVDFAKFKQLV